MGEACCIAEHPASIPREGDAGFGRFRMLRGKGVVNSVRISPVVATMVVGPMRSSPRKGILVGPSIVHVILDYQCEIILHP